jgi:hypothetical protein
MLIDCYREDTDAHLADTPAAKKEELILQAA